MPTVLTLVDLITASARQDTRAMAKRAKVGENSFMLHVPLDSIIESVIAVGGA